MLLLSKKKRKQTLTTKTPPPTRKVEKKEEEKTPPPPPPPSKNKKNNSNNKYLKSCVNILQVTALIIFSILIALPPPHKCIHRPNPMSLFSFKSELRRPNNVR